jgi:hypothetical protein
MEHPIAVYTAASNVEAHLVCSMLINEGVEAAAVDDDSRAAVWELGLLRNIHKPQVWVDRTDAERARPLLAEYDRQLAQRQQAGSDVALVDAECEECGKSSSYPSSRWGFVEVCPKCGAFVDVGTDHGLEGWDVNPEL